MESMQKDEKNLALEQRFKDYKENLTIQEENGAKLSKLYELGLSTKRWVYKWTFRVEEAVGNMALIGSSQI